MENNIIFVIIVFVAVLLIFNYMKEVNIYIKDSYDAVITKDGHYDVLLTTQGKELRLKKYFSHTAPHKLIIYGAIDAIKQLNQSCIINLYTTMPFGMKRIRHGDGTWREELGRSVNINLLVQIRDLILNGGHVLNNIYDKELVDIMFSERNNQRCANDIKVDSRHVVSHEKVSSTKINDGKAVNCMFCNLNANHNMIYQTATCYAFYVADTVSPGHALIVPKRHVESYFDLTKKEREALDAMLVLVKKLIDERFHPDGYKVGFEVNEVARQSISHVHIHIIPCYKGYVVPSYDRVEGVIPYRSTYDKNDNNQDDLLECDVEKKDMYEKSKNHTDSLYVEQPKERQKVYTLDQKRDEYGNSYLPWEAEADALLIHMYEKEGKSIKLLSEIFERAPGAIRSRLKKLGKIE